MALTKFFYSTMKGAPALESTWGSMLAVLKATLVSGFNSQQVSSVAIADGIATLTLASNHGFIQHQVVEISGANEAAFNGDYVVQSVTATTITVSTVLTSATGSMTIKTAPLGFTEVFTGDNKSVFRAKNTIKNPFYLRVDDSLPVGYDTTWAKFARVTIAESMLGVDDFGAYPKAPQSTVNEVGNGITGGGGIYGIAKWYHAVRILDYLFEAFVPSAYTNDWVLIGDDANFYFLPRISYDEAGRAMYAFANLNTFSTTDKWAGFLGATHAYQAANANGSSFNGGNNVQNRWDSNSTEGKYLLRKYDGTGTDYQAAAPFSLNPGNNLQQSGLSGSLVVGANNQLLIHDVYIKAGNEPRGTLPFIKWIHQNWSFGDKQIFSGENGRYLVVYTDASDNNKMYFAFSLDN